MILEHFLFYYEMAQRGVKLTHVSILTINSRRNKSVQVQVHVRISVDLLTRLII